MAGRPERAFDVLNFSPQDDHRCGQLQGEDRYASQAVEEVELLHTGSDLSLHGLFAETVMQLEIDALVRSDEFSEAMKT